MTTHREFADPAAEASDVWRADAPHRKTDERDTGVAVAIPHGRDLPLCPRLAAEIIPRACHPVVIGPDTMLSEQETQFSRMSLDMAHAVEL